jgi:hypothetical protein
MLLDLNPLVSVAVWAWPAIRNGQAKSDPPKHRFKEHSPCSKGVLFIARFNSDAGSCTIIVSSPGDSFAVEPDLTLSRLSLIAF